jgi:SNF2 family DNA or RNA helicase
MPQTPADTPCTGSSDTEKFPSVQPIRSHGTVCGFLLGQKVKSEASPLWLQRKFDAGKARTTPILKKWLVDQIALRARADTFRRDERPLRIEPRALPYQCAGVRFVANMHRTLLFDDMGTGKTMQSLLAARATNARSVLVLAPKFLCAKWQREVEKWWPGTETLRLDDYRLRRKNVLLLPKSKPTQPVVVLANWDILNTEPGKQLQQITWDWVIADEAHAIRNRKTARTQLFRDLQCQNATMLTGTPIDSIPSELWTMLNFLHPDVFSSYWRFREQFVLTDIEEQGYSTGGGYGGKPVGAKNMDIMHDLISPWYIRRTRAETGLAEPMTVPVFIDMPDAQRKRYEQVASESLIDLGDGTDLSITAVIARLVRLRQVSVSPELLFAGEETSGKVDAAVQMCQTYPSEQLVFACTFRKGVEILVREMQMAGISADYIHGERKDLDEVVQRFRKGNFRVLCMTPVVGGFGHDLEVARIVTFVDEPWSSILRKQIVGRVARLGQTRDVVVHILLNTDSVDEAVREVCERKDETFSETAVASRVISFLRTKRA